MISSIYNVELNGRSIFFVDGDDGYNDYLYDAKPKMLNPRAEEFLTTAIDKSTGEVAFDSNAPARDGGENFYLGATDPVDYYKFTITEAGNYHFGAYDADLGGAKQTLYDADGKLLDSRKVSAHEVEELPTKYLAAGDYYLKMEWTGTTGDYNLGLLKA